MSPDRKLAGHGTGTRNCRRRDGGRSICLPVGRRCALRHALVGRRCASRYASVGRSSPWAAENRGPPQPPTPPSWFSIVYRYVVKKNLIYKMRKLIRKSLETRTVPAVCRKQDTLPPGDALWALATTTVSIKKN